MSTSNTTITRNDESGAKHGLSVSSMIEIPSGVHFNIFYYGQSDISVLSQHLLFIISSFIKTHEYGRNTGHIVITINTPTGITFADIENLLKGVCINHETEYNNVYKCQL